MLARHGEVEATSGLDPGKTERPLSERGRRQADALAAALRTAGAAAVYTSPLLPARATATPIAGALDLEAPQIIEALTSLQAEAWSALETLKELHPAEAVIVIVSDELTIRALVCRVLTLPSGQAGRFRIAPASLTTIEFRGQRTLLAALNHTCHLDGLG